jgi:hypothetical protein
MNTEEVKKWLKNIIEEIKVGDNVTIEVTADNTGTPNNFSKKFIITIDEFTEPVDDLRNIAKDFEKDFGERLAKKFEIDLSKKDSESNIIFP